MQSVQTCFGFKESSPFGLEVLLLLQQSCNRANLQEVYQEVIVQLILVHTSREDIEERCNMHNMQWA